MGQAASAIDEATGWTATTAVAGEALSEESATDSGGNSSPQERLLVQSGLSAERKDPDAGSEAFCPPESLDALLRCPICLETLQSPVVLYCGHYYCFVCLFNSMNAFGDSQCPVCRQAFAAVPPICAPLRRFLLRLERRRGEQQTTGTATEEVSLAAETVAGLADRGEEDEAAPASRQPRDLAEEAAGVQDASFGPFKVPRPRVGEGESAGRSPEETDLLPPTAGVLFQLLKSHAPDLLLLGASEPTENSPEESSFQPATGLRGERSAEQRRSAGDFPATSTDSDSDSDDSNVIFRFPPRRPRHERRRESSPSPAPRPAFHRQPRLTQEALVHVGVVCNSCGVMPIRGRRFVCDDCHRLGEVVSLCEECNAKKPSVVRFAERHGREIVNLIAMSVA